jgi:general secretion pathway protein F
VKSALVYPILVLATGCASIAVLFGFVIPRFRPVFEQLGAQPPLMAQIVLATGDIFSTYWWVPVIGLALLYLLWRRRGRSPEAQRRWHSRILALPHFGDLVIKIEMARFGRTLGTLLKNGVAPITALAITEQTLNNTALRAGIAAVSDRMKEGIRP